jgi:hypothetical protein
MNEYNEKIPDPKELEKELGDFLAKKFGGSVKLATPIVLPQAAESDSGEPPPKKGENDPIRSQTSGSDRLPGSVCGQAEVSQRYSGHENLHPL